MSKTLFYGIALWGVVLLLFAHPTCAQPSSNIVANIVVVGNNRVDASVILDSLKTKEGDFYSEETAREDTRELMQSAEFDSVEVEKVIQDNKVILTYRVVERPILSEIDIQGEKEISEKKLFAEINSKLDKPLNPATLNNDIIRIQNLYASKGMAQASIEYTIKPSENGQSALLSISIDEGPPSYVRQVIFSGNTVFSDTRLIFAMQTKPRFGFLFGKYDEYTLKEDIWTITEMYQKEGYIEVAIDYDIKPTEKRNGIALYISINEGPRYHIDKIAIRQGKLKGFYATNLLYEVAIYKGGIYSPQAVEKDSDNLRNYYRALGYADVLVSTKVLQSEQAVPSNMLVNVFFEIQENQVFDIGIIAIKGNDRTKDIVIRRELNILPGDRYNFYRIETSRQRLQNLNYFSKVEFYETDSKSIPNAKDIDIDVKEKLTGQLGVGVGFSSSDLVFGTITLEQPNFDYKNWRNFFVGGGQKLRIKSELGINRQDVVLSFTEPYFLYEKLHGRKVSAGFDVYFRNNGTMGPDYRILSVGGDVRAGTPISFRWVPRVGKYIGTIRADLTVIGEVLRVDVDKSLSYDDNIVGDDTQYLVRRRVNPRNGRVRRRVFPLQYEEYDKYLKEEEGTYVQAAPVISLTRDTRDNLLWPTRGSFSLFKTKIGLGTETYGLIEMKHGHYFKLFDLFEREPQALFSGSHVLLTRGSLGFATPNTPIFDRFFLGGAEELRGFSYGMAGPKDYSGNNAMGGTLKYFGSLEYMFPVYTHNEQFSLHASVWMDAGDVWWKERKYTKAYLTQSGNYILEEETRDNTWEINMTVGGSVILKMWRVPLRLNYGIPVVKDSESKDWDPLEGFTLGTGFSF